MTSPARTIGTPNVYEFTVRGDGRAIVGGDEFDALKALENCRLDSKNSSVRLVTHCLVFVYPVGLDSRVARAYTDIRGYLPGGVHLPATEVDSWEWQPRVCVAAGRQQRRCAKATGLVFVQLSRDGGTRRTRRLNTIFTGRQCAGTTFTSTAVCWCVMALRNTHGHLGVQWCKGGHNRQGRPAGATNRDGF